MRLQVGVQVILVVGYIRLHQVIMRHVYGTNCAGRDHPELEIVTERYVCKQYFSGYFFRFCVREPFKNYLADFAR